MITTFIKSLSTIKLIGYTSLIWLILLSGLQVNNYFSTKDRITKAKQVLISKQIIENRKLELKYDEQVKQIKNDVTKYDSTTTNSEFDRLFGPTVYSSIEQACGQLSSDYYQQSEGYYIGTDEEGFSDRSEDQEQNMPLTVDELLTIKELIKGDK